MANENKRLNYTIHDYSLYDTTKILLDGEIRFFDTILTGIIHPCSIIGDGSSQIQNLPFQEIIRISTASNINLEILRINGNRIFLLNTGVSSVTVNLGTAVSPDNYTLEAKSFIQLIFYSAAWHFMENKMNDDLEYEKYERAIVLNGNLVSSDMSSYDVAGINTIMVNTAGGNVTVNSFVNGENFQNLYIVKRTPGNNLIITDNYGGGGQIIRTKSAANVTLTAYGNVSLSCYNNVWFSDQ